MAEKANVGDQTLETGGLYRCCQQSWSNQIERVLDSGDIRIVCTSCKLVLVQSIDGNTWRWSESNKEKIALGTSKTSSPSLPEK